MLAHESSDSLEAVDGSIREPGAALSAKRGTRVAVSTPRARANPRLRPREAVAGRATQIARALVVAAVFLVPVTLDVRTIDVFNLAKITVLWVLTIAAAGAWLFAFYVAPKTHHVRHSALMRNAAALVVVSAVATIFSANRTLSVFGLYQRYECFVSLVLYAGFAALIFVLHQRRSESLREIAMAIGAAAGLVSVYVMAQGAGHDPLHLEINSAKTAPGIGTLGNADFASSYLGIAVPFLVYLAITARSQRRRVMWSVLTGVTLVGIAVTQGRGGIVAVLTGVLALALFSTRLPAAAKAGIVVVAFVALALSPFAAGRLPFAQRGDLLRTGTLVYRTQMWDAGLHMVLERPILGWGPETFYGNFPRFRPLDEARTNELAIADKPHNIFVNWAVTTGVVGLIAYLILVGGALWLVIARAPVLAGPGRLLAATFGAGLVAYLAQGLFSIDVVPLASIGWIAVGAIAAVFAATETPSMPGDIASKDRVSRRRPNDPLLPSYIPLAAMEIGLLVLMVFGLGPLRADHAAWAAKREPWRAIALYEKARQLNPHEAAYNGLHARYLERLADDPSSSIGSASALRRSASLWELTIDAQPGNLNFLLAAVAVYGRLGTDVDAGYFVQANRWMAKAARLDRRDPKIHVIYATLLHEWAARTGGAAERRELERRAQTETALAQTLRVGR